MPNPNDDRSNVKNPNNPAYEADRQNRLKQGHPAPPPPSDRRPGDASPKK